MDSCEGRIIQDGEPITTSLDRLLQPNRCQSVQRYPEPETDRIETSDEQEDGVDGEF